MRIRSLSSPLARAIAALTLLGAVGVASAQSYLDLNLSGDAIRADFASDIGIIPGSNAINSIGAIYSDDDNQERFTQFHTGLLVTGDAGARNALVQVGLGVRGVFLDVGSLDTNGGAIALGGQVDARLPQYNRIGMAAYAYYAPDVSAFGDVDKYLEYAANINYELIRNAFVYVGARQVRYGFDPGDEMAIDTGAHGGFQLKF